MTNQFDKKLMLSFLEKNYPISRIKHNGRFKRGIVLDNGQSFLMSSNQHNLSLKFQLVEILMTVFSCDEPTSRAVLSNFLLIG